MDVAVAAALAAFVDDASPEADTRSRERLVSTRSC